MRSLGDALKQFGDLFIPSLPDEKIYSQMVESHVPSKVFNLTCTPYPALKLFWKPKVHYSYIL